MRVKILNVACAAGTIQKLIAVPRSAGRFLSLLVQRKKPKKARPGWRDLSRYTSGSAGKSGAHIPVRLFALPLAALTPPPPPPRRGRPPPPPAPRPTPPPPPPT